MTQVKEKLSENIQTNFNHSKEVAYWAKKFNISPSVFQKAFEECGYSISKTLQLCNQKFK
jgi:AraC-like DNA-binding protein